jgi:hypothetical protein
VELDLADAKARDGVEKLGVLGGYRIQPDERIATAAHPSTLKA